MTEEVTLMPIPCAYCGELLADSHVGLRSHYEIYHPETRPAEYVAEASDREMAVYKRRELARRMERRLGVWHFFGKEK